MAPSAPICEAGGCPALWGILASPLSPAGNSAMLGLFAALIPPLVFTGLRYGARIHSGLLLLAIIFEVVGHVARILLVSNPTSHVYLTLYLLGTHWGAVLVGSSLALVLPHIMVIYGDEFQLVSEPGYVNVFFLVVDVFTLAFQSIGIGFASTAEDSRGGRQGMNILIAGLAIQTAGLIALLGAYRYFRYKLHHRRYILDDTYAHVYLTKRFRYFLICLQISISLLLIRAAVRLGIFANGLASDFARSELTTFLLDDALVFLSALLLITQPPGRAFGDAWRPTSPLAASSPPPSPSFPGTPGPTNPTTHTLPFRRHRRNRSSRIYNHVISLPYSSPIQSPRFSPVSATLRNGMPSGLPAHPSPTVAAAMQQQAAAAAAAGMDSPATTLIGTSGSPLASPLSNPVHHRGSVVVASPPPTTATLTPGEGTFVDARESPGLEGGTVWTNMAIAGQGEQQQQQQQHQGKRKKRMSGRSRRDEEEMVDADALW